MIKRYPCQAVILFVLGILAAKGVGLQRASGCHNGGAWLSVLSLAAALLLIGIWAGRERLRRRKICLAAILIAAYGAGILRMHFVSDALQRRTAGIADGQKAAVQGKIIKKQCKEAPYADEQDLGGMKDKKQQPVSHISNLNTKHVNINRKCSHKFDIYQNFIKSYEQISFQSHRNRISRISVNGSVSTEYRQWTIYLTDVYLSTKEGIRSCGNVIVYVKCAEPVIGNTVLLTGKSILFQTARNDGSFDERAYYQNQGYSFKIYADDNSYQTADAKKDTVREYLYAVQQKLMQVYGQAMPEQEAGALCAMLLGEKSLLFSWTKELYRRSGISHILAISGLHISILGAAVYQLLRKRGVSYIHASVIAMGMLLMFVLMTGMGLSAVRAVIMFGIYLGSACAGRAYDSVNGLAAAAACILAYNPCALFLAAFQLSFAAVAGVLFGREICRIFKPRLKLTEALMISTGIQILTLPLTVWYYFEIPLYSLPLNLFVLPFVEIVLITGMLGGGFGLAALAAEPFAGGFALIYAVFGMLSDGLLSVCACLLRYFTEIGELFLELPGAVCILGRPRGWQMVCCYMTAAGSAWLIAWAADKTHEAHVPKPAGAVFRGQKPCKAAEAGQEIFFERLQKSVPVFCVLFCLALIFLRMPKRQEVAVLDVGQGDGIYIHTSGGMDIFIDGGSTDVKNAGIYRILPFLKSRGVTGVDLWFVSHLDKDHISGLEEIADSGYRIGQVVFAKGIVKDDAYKDLLDLLDKRRIPVRHLGRGERLRGKNAGFTCLWPSDTAAADDRNAASLALLYEDRGFRAFFPGDMSAEEEKKLLDETDISHVTLYKAAHHGSKYSNSQEMLQRLCPDVSVVSCAEKNDYGHPGREAVEIMQRCSGCVYYTMHSGQVSICRDRRGVFVQEYIPGSLACIG